MTSRIPHAPRANAYEPDFVPPPGETLAEALEEQALSQAELAERMGRPKKTINEIVKGKAEITPETALQLERVLRIPADFWLALERHYRAFLAERAESEQLQEQVSWLSKFPIKEMIAFQWIEPKPNKVELRREVLTFFGAATPSACDDLNQHIVPAFRRSLSVEADPGAIAAWLRQGEIEARSIRCKPFDRQAFSDALRKARELTQEEPAVMVERLQDLCAAAGVAVVFVPGTRRMTASGATRWISRDKALVQLSLRHKTDDHLWFTFFHEGAHVLLHGKRESFVDWADAGTGSDEIESEADRFARDQLIPREAYAKFLDDTGSYVSHAQITKFARSVGVAPGIVVGRLQYDKVVAFAHFNDLKQRFEWDDPSSE
jgi:HTH-type transcriptional regulator / antitoxin HigA